ncbi:unnamed protein product [Effrenium voratum]|nr:unnamed protein product [Effrenium voratum]
MWGSARDAETREWQLGRDMADQSSRLMGKMQGYISGHTPLETERSCTDCIWIPLFAAALVGFLLCLQEASARNGFQHLTSLPDYEGNLCGTGGQGQYLYFCREEGIGLDLHHQICLESCPLDTSTTVFCRGTGTRQQSYPSHSLAGMICLPNSQQLSGEVKQLFNSNPYVKTLFDALELTYDWEQLVVAAVVASVLSYAYLFCISLCASILVWLCLILLIAAPTGLGILYVYMSATPEIIVPQSFPGLITTGDANNDLTFGLALCGVGALLACIAICKAKSIQQAVGSIEEAADCIRAMPLLSVEPWISSAVKLLVFIPGVIGFLMLNMAGNIASHVDLTQSKPVYTGDPLVAVCLIYYLVVFVWILELIHAISQFVVMFTAQVWFFRMRGSETTFWANFTAYDMLFGYLYGTTYHLGSLLYGSFLCTLFRVARMLATLLVKAEQETGNPVAACVLKVFVCCLSCAETLVQYVTGLAFCDVAMNSSTYCEGAAHAVRIISGNASALVAVEGLAQMFSFVGIGVVSAGTAGICWMLSTSLDRYSNPMSEHYVPDSQMLVILFAIIGAVMAVPFMHLFDTICDTIVYCNSTLSMRLPTSWGSNQGGFMSWFGFTGH